MIIRFTDPAIGDLQLQNEIDIPLNFAVGDIRDISKRSGSFSKTITIPGSKQNNIILNNLFDPNVVDSFGVNKVKRCQLIDSDGLIVKDNLIFQLIGTNKIQDNILTDDEIEWEVLLKDSVADFFTKINNKELTDIAKAKFDTLNHTWNGQTIIDSFSNTETDGYKYWLTDKTPDENLPVLTIREFGLAIYAKKYWDWIHAEAGFTYEWGELSDPYVLFDKLLVTDNKSRQELNELATKLNEIVYNQFDDTPDMGLAYRANFITPLDYLSSVNNIRANIQGPNIVKDPQNAIIYEPNQSTVTPPGSITTRYITDLEPLTAQLLNGATNAFGYNTYTKINNGLQIVNISSYLSIKLIKRIPTPGFFKVYENGSVNELRPKIQVYLTIRNTTLNSVSRVKVIEKYPQDFNNNQFQSSSTLFDNLNKILDNELINISVPILGNINDVFIFSWEMEFIPTNITGLNDQVKFGFVNVVGPGFLNIDPYLILGPSTVSIKSVEIETGNNMPVAAWIPKKIKQSEFIKSIANMYNLYAYTDPLNPNKIIWKSRDKFYDEGDTLNWTYKFAKDEQQQLTYLPELVNKKTILTYKSDDDSFNKTYTDATREIYGQQEVIFDSEFVKDTDTKELIFSPTPFKYNQIIGGYVPLVDNISNAYNIRLFIDGGVQNANNTWGLIDTPTNIQTVNVYPLTIHMSGIGGGSLDINFGPCDFYFTDLSFAGIPTSNLFNLYWRRTFAQIDKGKMLTCYMHLNNNDISNLKLNSKILIDNTYWLINKIEDYLPNTEGLTKCEFISLEDSVNLNLNLVNTNTQPGLAPTNELKANQLVPFLQNNIRNSQILTDEPVILLKSGMVVEQGRKGLIIDENVSITDEGLSTSNVKINQDSIEFGAINAINKIQGLNDTIEVTTSEGGVGYSMLRTGPNTLAIEAKDSVTDTISIISLQGNDISLFVNDGIISKEIFLSKDRLVINGLDPYADDADAGTNGLITGDVYQTNGLGALPAGIIMIKQ